MAQNYLHATIEACRYLGIDYESISKKDLQEIWDVRDKLYSDPIVRKRRSEFHYRPFTEALYLSVLFYYFGIPLSKKCK